MEQIIPTAIIGVILGWLLGLLAPGIQEHIQQKRRRKSICRGMLNEISQLRLASADVFFGVNSKLGYLDRKLLEWYRSIRGDKGRRTLPPQFAQMDDITDRILEGPEELLTSFAHSFTMKPGEGLNIREFDLPYTRSKLGQLELFSEASQQHILELLHRVSIFNQQILESRFYYKLTFDSSLSENNHKSVSEQCSNTYESIGQQAKLIIEFCEAATTDLKKEC